MSKIYLIGYMGSGKSTAGKKLANKMGYEFIDMDAFIETEYQLSIPEIFKTKGESGFRQLEREALQTLSTKDGVVIACGGGTPCFNDNMDVMKASGITVYLKLSVDVLVSRLLVAKEQRPLIANKTEAELRTFITRQLEVREDFYRNAHYIVKGKDLNVDELVTFIQEQVG
jgi:shikimate kinase